MCHLNADQKAALLTVLERYEKLFNETLGVYLHKKFYIELEEGATPGHN